MQPSPQEIRFPKDKAVKTYIQYISDDGSLWVNLASDLHKVEDVTNTLNSMAHDEIKESPVVHEIVCALHNDDTWYRACVLSTEPNFRVQFIDFGDTLDVPLCKLAQLPETLRCIQPLAVKVKLPPSSAAEPSVGSSLLLQYIDCVEGTVMVDVIQPVSGTDNTVSCEEFAKTQDISHHHTCSAASENSFALDNASGLVPCNTYQTQIQSSQHELEATSTSVNNAVSCVKDQEHLTPSEAANTNIEFSYTTDQATDLLATPFYDTTLTLQCGAEATSHLPIVTNSGKNMNVEECNFDLSFEDRPESGTFVTPQSNDGNSFKTDNPYYIELTSGENCDNQSRSEGADITQADGDAEYRPGEPSPTLNSEETIFAEECFTALPSASQPEYDVPDIPQSDDDASCKAGEPSPTLNSEETIFAEECFTALPSASQPEYDAPDISQSDSDASCKAGEPSPTLNSGETTFAEGFTALPSASQPEYDAPDISPSDSDASCKAGEPSPTHNSEETIFAEECFTALPSASQPEYDAPDISQSDSDASCKAEEPSPTYVNQDPINAEECSAALLCGTQPEHDASAIPLAGELSSKYDYQKPTNAEECTATKIANQPENHASVIIQSYDALGKAGELSPNGTEETLNTGVCTTVLSVENQQENNASVISLCKAEELSPTYENELINAEECSAALSWTNVLFKSEDPFIPPPSNNKKLINNDKCNLGLGLCSADVLSDQSVTTNADALVSCESEEASIPPLPYNDVVINPDKGNLALSCVNYPDTDILCKVVEESNISPSYGQDLIDTFNGKSPNRQTKNTTVSGINEHSLWKPKPSTDLALPSPKDASKDRFNLPSNSSNINDSNMHRQQKPRLITKGRTTDASSNLKDSSQSARIPSTIMAVPTKLASNSFQELKSILELELSIVREQNRLEMLALQKKTEQNLANQIDTIKEEVSRQLQALFNEVNNRLQFLHDSMGHKMAEMYSDISLLKNESEAGEKNTKSSAKHSGKKHQPTDSQNTTIAKDLIWNSQHQYHVELGAQFGINYHLSSQKHSTPSYSFQEQGKRGVNQPMVYSNEKMLQTPNSDQLSTGIAICHSSLSQNNYQHHSTHPKMDHIQTGQGILDAAKNKPLSRIVSVNNLNTQKINPNHLFNLFGVYGKVCLVKIITAQHKAFIEMSDANQAGEAICHLNNVQLMGRRLRVTSCKFDKLQFKREDFQNDTCKDFTKSPQHNKSQRTIFQKMPPTNTLKIVNILNTVSQEKLKEVFSKGGHPVKSLRMVKLNDEKSKAYAEFGSIEEAVNALTVMHLQETTDWVRMFIVFARGH